MIKRLALIIAAASLLAGCALSPNDNVLPGQVGVGSDGYTVIAPFDNVQNLVPNSNVQYNNVTIGTVAQIKVNGWHAMVKLRLRKSVPLPANVTLKIAQKSLLGAEYVEVDDPAGPAVGRLAQNATLPMTQTGNYPETEQVLSAVSLLLNNGGLSQINTITTQLNAALINRTPDVRSVITNLQTLLTTLNDQKSNVVAALEQVQTLSAQLAAQRDTVATAIDRITPGLKALNAERAKLVSAIDAVGRFGVTATSVVNLTQRTILTNLANIRPVLEQLNAAGDDLPKALNYLVTIPFPAQTLQNALKGDYANLFATIDVSLPTLAESFLGLGDKTVPTAMQKTDPVRTPAGITAPRSTPAPSTSSSSAPTPTAPPTSMPPTPPAKCNLLKQLLGGC